MKLILPTVFEVLTEMEHSGSTLKVDAPCPFEILAPTCETTLCNTTKDKSVVICDVCGCLIEYIWRVLMHNNVGIIDYVSVVLTCLHAGLFLRKLFAALTFVLIILSLYEEMAR